MLKSLARRVLQAFFRRYPLVPFMFVLAVVLTACETTEDVKPDPTGTSSATTGDTSSSSSGTGGSGGTSNTQATFTAGTRLKVRTMTGSDGSSQQLGFYDSQLQTSCEFGNAEDGKARCLPFVFASPKQTVTIYLDDQCTQAFEYLAFNPGVDPCPGYVRHDLDLGQRCASKNVTKVSTYDGGPVVPFDSTPYFQKNAQGCTPFPTTGLSYYPITHMDPVGFVEGTEAVGE